jgi:hypothetical protein
MPATTVAASVIETIRSQRRRAIFTNVCHRSAVVGIAELRGGASWLGFIVDRSFMPRPVSWRSPSLADAAHPFA